MIIVKPSATLLSITPNAAALIERAGRVCYKSEDKIGPGTAKKFVEMLKGREHLSVIEHASASILFVCDRGVSHEIVRHRLASYSQESTRYVNYGKADGITVIEPPFTEDQAPARTAWYWAMDSAEQSYLKMIDLGISQ